jgi:hypothetical protein
MNSIKKEKKLNRTIHSCTKLGVTILLGLAVGQERMAMGGWSGQMNGVGYGKTSVNVIPSVGTGTTLANGFLYYPSTAMAPAPGYTATAPLPAGSSSSTYARSQGLAGYKWSNSLFATGGDRTDNVDIQSRVDIDPAACAALTMDSSAEIGEDGRSGLISVNASATAGAALLLRGYEFIGVPTSEEDVKTNGKLKWEMLLVGPFDLNQETCTAIKIPFRVDSGVENLYFVSDGAALSKSFAITCPNNIDFGSSQELSYPAPVIEGGCGNVTVTFDPPANQLPSCSSTLVTVTATDELNNQVRCTFTATRRVLTFSGFFAPINGVGGECENALRTIKKGSNVPVKFTTSCGTELNFSGQPTIEVRPCSGGEPVASGPFKIVANAWHFNWDTSIVQTGTYRLIVTLQDGSQKEAVVRIK